MGLVTPLIRSYILARGHWRPWAAWLALAVLSAVLLAACGGGASTAASSGSSSAGVAPDFELALFANANHAKGEVLRLSQLQGHPVVVNFWYPTCPPCRVEMPEFQQTFQKYKAQGVEFIGIQQVGLDSAEDGQNFVGEYGITYAVGPDKDGSTLINYRVTGFPTTVFLDRDHRILRKWTGPLNAEKLEEFIQQLLN